MGAAKMGDHDETAVSDTSPDGRRWAGIDHVQVAIPVGGEPLARAFYASRLGLGEVPKPAEMAGRGGAWFEAGATRIHVGVEPDFVPARKAHPALLVHGLRDLVRSAGLDARWSDEIPGTVRCHVDDPFGNRIELIEAGPP
jgi:pimeloyl-ACP methyl ester carboxylesterase